HHSAIDIDAIETRNPMQAHDVAWAQRAAPHLDDEIRSPGEEATIGPEPRAKGDGLGQRGWLVVFEAHGFSRDARGSCLLALGIGARRSGALTSHEPSRTDTVKP